MNARRRPRRPFCLRLLPLPAAVAAIVLALTACNGSDAAVATATPPPVAPPPAELAVQRGTPACYTRRFPAADIPTVRGYRLAAGSPLPEGVVPSVRNVRFLGSGQARVLDAEVCFSAEPSTPSGPLEAQLELRLYNADSERLSLNDRVQPVRTLRFTQRLVVR